MLRVLLLGELEVGGDGVRLAPPRGARPRALMGWLALEPGMHDRSHVAGRLWPAGTEDQARANLRTALWTLRAALGAEAGALSADRRRVGFAGDRIATDLAAFDAHADAGRLDEAVALCRGPLLDGIDDDWAAEARAAHDHRVASVMTRLVSDAQRRGTLEEAIEWAWRLVRLDPLDEAAARELMRLLADGGRRFEAVAVYERLRNRMSNVLGAAPETATSALAERIRERGALPLDGAPPAMSVPVVAAVGAEHPGRC